MFNCLLKLINFLQKPEVEVIDPIPQAKYLHLLVTSPQPTANACRLVVSAAANHYPTANLIAFEDYYSLLNSTQIAPLGKHTLRIRSIRDFFTIMGPERDEDVILIPDSEGTVFQLRPDVLMERYWEIVRLGQARAKIGMSDVDGNSTFQKIVFGASKTCSESADDVACFAAPQSILKSDVYGGKTDRVDAKRDDPTLYMRERYINSRFVMGELKALRAFYNRALEYMEADKAAATEQSVVSRIFGEQEYHRAALRKDNSTEWDGRKHSIKYFFGLEPANPLDESSTHLKPNFLPDINYEFGIGLDYEGLLISPTSHEQMMGFVSHNSTANINKLRKQHSISASGGKSLPDDITRSTPPFWSRNPLWDSPRYPKLGWNDVLLFKNLWTGTIPATFSAITSPKPPNGDALIAHIAQTWQHTWFHRHIRAKLNDYTQSPDRQFTTLIGAGKQTAWWGIWREKWMLRRTKRHHEGEHRENNDEWIEWGDVCDAFWDEVTGDAIGMWKSPVHDW